MQQKVSEIEYKIRDQQKESTRTLPPAAYSGKPAIPTALFAFFISSISVNKFIELFGDRNFKDDKAIVGGLGEMTAKPICS